MPYAAVATDLETAEEVVFRSGSLIEAIRASISMPGVFTPVPCGNSYLIDGGLVNPLPVNVVRAMGATRVVAVNINNNLKCGSVKHHAPKKPGTLSEAFHQHFLHFNWKDDGNGGDGGSEAPGDTPEEEAERKAGHGGDPATDLHKMNLFDVFTRSLRIAEDKITIECIRNDPPDILIEPAVGDIATMDFSRAEDAIEAGYEATLAAMGGGLD